MSREMRIPIIPSKQLKAHRHWEVLKRSWRDSDNKIIYSRGIVLGAVLLAAIFLTLKHLGV